MICPFFANGVHGVLLVSFLFGTYSHLFLEWHLLITLTQRFCGRWTSIMKVGVIPKSWTTCHQGQNLNNRFFLFSQPLFHIQQTVPQQILVQPADGSGDPAVDLPDGST